MKKELFPIKIIVPQTATLPQGSENQSDSQLQKNCRAENSPQTIVKINCKYFGVYGISHI